jgi:ATP-binding cassette, subfamily B, multidrug efflux pump
VLVRLLGLVSPYRRQAVMALGLLSAAVVLDLAIPRLIAHLIDHGIARRDHGVVLHTSLVMLGIAAVSTVIAVGNNLYSVRVGEGVARDLREQLFLKIQQTSFGNLDRQKTGPLLVRLTSDVSAVSLLIRMTLRIGTRAPLLMIGSLALMISTSGRLALALLPLLLVTLGLIAFFALRSEPLFRQVQHKLDVLNNLLQENVSGARLIKGLARGDHESARF